MIILISYMCISKNSYLYVRFDLFVFLFLKISFYQINWNGIVHMEWNGMEWNGMEWDMGIQKGAVMRSRTKGHALT